MIDGGILREIRRDHERRGLLPSTTRRRQIHITAFGRYLGERGLFDATPDDVQHFLDGRPINARSRYTWIASLHSFYVWAIDAGHTVTDPTARIVRPRLRRMLPRPIPTESLRLALALADRVMQCWLLLGAFEGLRCQEIAGLRREDVLQADQLLRVVHAKGGHERLVPLHADVAEAIDRLPRLRSGWLFERPQGGPFTANRVSVLISAHLHDIGVDATAHQLRHWFGTSLYQGTHDLRLVQEMMGHATPQTTALYTAFDHRAARVGVSALRIDLPKDAA